METSEIPSPCASLPATNITMNDGHACKQDKLQLVKWEFWQKIYKPFMTFHNYLVLAGLDHFSTHRDTYEEFADITTIIKDLRIKIP